ncbi:MAG: SpoIID/LytB domain-containing protein [Marinifilaceae bacterium]
MEDPQLKIGICAAQIISINLLNEYYIKNIGTTLFGKYSLTINNKSIELIDSGNNIIHKSNEISFHPSIKERNIFEIEDVTIGINFHWEKKEKQKFNGNLKFIIEKDNIRAINTVKIEDYLFSVISSEMNANAPTEYLKSHAIISRSWVLSRIAAENQKDMDFIDNNEKRIKWYGREEHINFDVCADDHCQRYQGITRACTEAVKEAIKETKGIVLYKDNNICDARFSKCCGGVSEDFENVWENEKISYLSTIIDSENKDLTLDLKKEEDAREWITSETDSFCNVKDKHLLSRILNDYDYSTSNFYRWEIEYSQEELSNLLLDNSNIDFGEIKKITALKRGVSGRIYELEIEGSKKTFTFGKELEIRKVLSKSHLYSSAFIVDYKKVKKGIPGKFILKGSGWGHGVGLCQIGAAAMVYKGYSHEKVLKHYFKGTELKKIY